MSTEPLNQFTTSPKTDRLHLGRQCVSLLQHDEVVLHPGFDDLPNRTSGYIQLLKHLSKISLEVLTNLISDASQVAERVAVASLTLLRRSLVVPVSQKRDMVPLVVLRQN